MLYIKKREGATVPFDAEKIMAAVRKANEQVPLVRQLNDAQIEGIADKIRKKLEKMENSAGVEEIQEMVEIGIMEMRGYEVAQKYIRYRYMRQLARMGKLQGDKNTISGTTADAVYVSIWDGGREVKSLCTVDLVSHEIRDVEIVPVQDDLGSLERECIRIGEDEYPVDDKDSCEPGVFFWKD